MTQKIAKKIAKKTAVVFAYHDVGVRCLEVLKKSNLDIKLVVTHHDDSREKIWFQSVFDKAKDFGLEVIRAREEDIPKIAEQVENLKPDFIFSFYFRYMLPERILKAVQIESFNMHGSLLPKYRGRVPINWAIIKGETETGATLHTMTVKPDAGDIIDQKSVPILPDETASDVFDKVVKAAVDVLERSIPSIINNNFQRKPNQLHLGSYFGGRKPDDGKIDPNNTSLEIYNLIRALSPPYPGAFILLDDFKFFIYRARFENTLNIKYEGTPGIKSFNGKYYLQNQAGCAIEIVSCSGPEQEEVSATTFFSQPSVTKKLPLPWNL